MVNSYKKLLGNPQVDIPQAKFYRMFKFFTLIYTTNIYEIKKPCAIFLQNLESCLHQTIIVSVLQKLFALYCCYDCHITVPNGSVS